MVATTIYALCDPDLQIPVIRYIGKTIDLKTRFRDHLTTSARHKSHLGCWLRSLKNRGEKPVLLTLTEVPDDIGSLAEILYIRLAREGGMDLVNATDGGEGITQTLETRKKLSVSKLGKKSPVFERHGSANSFFGGKHSEEQKAKWSQERRGKSLRKRSGAASGYLGVSLHKITQSWAARITVAGKRIWLGLFKSEIDAAKAYDAAALRLFGPNAKLNFPVTCCGSGT